MGENPQEIQNSLDQSILKTSSPLKWLFLCNYIYFKCLTQIRLPYIIPPPLISLMIKLPSHLMDLNSPRFAELLIISCFYEEDA